MYSLPNFLSGEEVMAALRDLPWPMWLDSGRPAATAGRYDLCVADPVMTLVSEGGGAVLRDRHGQAVQRSGDPLGLLRQVLDQRRAAVPLSVPFGGGAVGYFGYDLGLRVQGAAARNRPESVPEMAVGIYDWAVVSDNLERRSWWVGRESARDILVDLQQRLSAPPASVGEFLVEPGSCAVMPDWPRYRRAFERVHDYLLGGDCYQVNLARRFSARFRGDSWSAYCRLRQLSPAAFGAYLSLPFADVLSISPERFLLLQGERVETRPIKGTRPRRADPAADAAEAEALRASPKDRAENVMIVDLLRNDLGRVCRPGSVVVDRLFDIESYATVHHLVSTVSGELRSGLGAVDLLAACLPGGSITGAPKLRAMEIIDELEPARRGVYCGAIGYIGDDGRMDTNIAIRTAVCKDGEISYWAGGGVVADSSAEAEFEETVHKAKPYLDLVESVTD